MKKIMFFFFLIMFPLVTSASIKNDSIIYCNGNYYGIDNDNWYIIKKKNNKWIYDNNQKVVEPSCNNKKLIEVKFSKCIDGDTAYLIIDGKKERVRLLAIDTPESVTPEKPVEKYGKEASDYTCNILKKAKVLQIEYEENSDKKDKYDRPLVYLYADNKMVQKELLRKGYAELKYLYKEYKYTEQLKEIENKAKEKHLGIWSEENDSSKNRDVLDVIINFFKTIIKGI